MPRVSDAYRVAQHETILDAAEACFSRKGVVHTRVDDIAAECGLSVGAIYRYFNSRDAIIAGVAERSRERDRAAMVQLYARAMSIREQILLGLVYFLGRPADWIALDTITIMPAERDREAFVEWVSWMAGRYEELQAEGRIRDDIPASHIARQLILTYEGLAVLLSAGEPGVTEALLESIATILADGLSPR
ncbi:MAG TPA: helix-turn-helix domain-containing protein [Tepidiformaceae bacterium]|nr:helix-turn-helix domain-containing protein [Tepidiformaceae bacterium]